ncbi:SCO2521 family protein [Nocardia sp. NBC_00881]|uniref:SCO2521 family protein n=1 Tax=Nocardia sp. NBC_00881 TaxID=2975995 RepID=UPI00386C0E0B|nr:SCO2521 family protein [Nocardia sp. NBC_00881]
MGEASDFGSDPDRPSHGRRLRRRPAMPRGRRSARQPALAGRTPRAVPEKSPTPAAAGTRPLILLGEVRTCLVPDSTALSRDMLEELLALIPGEKMPWRERPTTLATSPTIAVGVDCQLATRPRGGVRAVGTVATNAVVVGGRVLQSSAHTTVVPAETRQRQTWAHYLTRVGVMEVISKVTDSTGGELADCFLAPGEQPDGTLDLASISQRLLARIRMDMGLDQHAPMQTRTARLRWAARIADVPQPILRFQLQDELVRTVLVTVHDESELAVARRFCEDLALHDWLLTVARAVVEEADLHPPSSTESAEIIAPLLTHLAHLWMPGAHTPGVLRGLWEQVERNPGFTREWQAQVGQLRDRMSAATLAAMRPSKINTPD